MTEEAGVAWGIYPENPEALAEAIQEIVAKPGEAERRAKAGRLWIEREFVRDMLALRMLKFMEKTLQSGQR